MDNHLYVEAKVNNQGPYVFMIDTGSSMTLISESVIEDMGLSFEQHAGSLQGIGGSIPYYRTKLDIDIGGAHINDLNVAIHQGKLPPKVTGVELAGLIGNDLLEQFVVELDYSNQQLKLESQRGYLMPQAAVEMSYQDRQITVPLLFSSSDHLFQVNAILDTGTNQILLNKAQLAASISEEEFQSSSALFQGLGGSIYSSQTIETKNLSVGSLKLAGPQEAYLFSPSPRRSNKNILGANVFANQRLIIDYGQQKIALLPAEQEKQTETLSEHYYTLLSKNKIKLNLEQKIELLIFSNHLDEAADLLIAEEELSRDNLFLLIDILLELGRPLEALGLLKDLDPLLLAEQNLLSSRLILEYFIESKEASLKLASELMLNEPTNSIKISAADLYALDGNIQEAKSILASLKGEAPYAQKLRRAWYAYLEGDTISCLSALRQALHHPADSQKALFFYIQHFATGKHSDLLQADIEQENLKKLVDMQLFAHQKLNNEDKFKAYLVQSGSYCAPLNPEETINCKAWLAGLAGKSTKAHLSEMSSLIKEHPRSTFIDTYAFLLSAEGEDANAFAAQSEALLNAPSSLHMLWQWSHYRKNLSSDK